MGIWGLNLQPLGEFCNFLGKNSDLNAVLILFFRFLDPLGTNKRQNLEDNLNK